MNKIVVYWERSHCHYCQDKNDNRSNRETVTEDIYMEKSFLARRIEVVNEIHWLQYALSVKEYSLISSVALKICIQQIILRG